MISIDTSQFDLTKARKLIDKFVAKKVSQIASATYNTILSNTKPKWSGQYLASWTINVGSPEYKGLPDAKPSKSHGGADRYYPKAGKQSVLINPDSPYQKVYITNDAHHAMMVEYEGTPTHPAEGWMIAHHALTTTVSQFRFF